MNQELPTRQLTYQQIKESFPAPNITENSRAYEALRWIEDLHNDINAIPDVEQQSELVATHDAQAEELWAGIIDRGESADNNPHLGPERWLQSVKESVGGYPFFSNEVNERLLAIVNKKLREVRTGN